MLKLIVTTSLIATALALTNQSHLKIYQEGIGLFGFFFLFAIIGGCGYCYFRFCRGVGGHHGRNRGWFHDNSSDSSDHYRRPPPQPYPQQVYQRPPPPPPMPGRYNPPPPYVSNDMTRAANQQHFTQNWQGPDHFAQRQLKQNCGFCHEYMKYNEQPRMMLNCHDHHAFHITCLNQHRIATSRGLQFQGTTICPACSETSTDKVRYFCTICKQMYVWVDLGHFSDQQGVIDTTRLTNFYGQYCPTCRNMG